MVTKEFREFFLRHSIVTSGLKPDQEAAFPTQYYVGAVLKYNRFLKNDYPSEKVFTKLFESLTFKLNPEDTGTDTAQGLVRTATDTESINRVDSITGVFTRVVKPYQLPTLVDDSTGTVTITIDTNGLRLTERTVTSSGRSRKSFSIKALYTNSITIDGSKNLQLVNDTNAPGNRYYYGTDGSGVKGFFNLASYVAGLITTAVSAVTYTYDRSVDLSGGFVRLVNDLATPGNWKFYGTDGAGAKGYQDLSTKVNSLIDAKLPAGTILMFNSATAPTGWAICDGGSGTPDLRGRFVVATGQNATPAVSDLNPTYAITNVGGENTHQLGASEMPAHTHTITNNDNFCYLDSGGDDVHIGGTGNNLSRKTPSIAITGGNVRHENRPPYYALTFIMKL